MSFIKSDDGFFINKDWIRFMKLRDSCYKICATINPCDNDSLFNVCKKTNQEEFKKLTEISKDFLPVNKDIYLNKRWIRQYREDSPGEITICTKPTHCLDLKSYFQLSKDLYPESCNLLKKNN